MPQGVKIFHFFLFYDKISDMDIISLNDTSNLYLVGGVVRDELLGIKSLDVDMVYEGNAIEDCADLGELIQVNPDFGTIRLKLNPHRNSSHFPDENGEILPSPTVRGVTVVDIASTRTENYPHKGHLPVVDKIGVPLKEDVMRRDFTINSLYKSVKNGEILDFTGGLEDLKNKKIRILHDKSFIDDPTRIIRALKFSHRFGFELEAETRKLRDEYLKNINYDMCYKRVKKELIETLGLNSDKLFAEFIKSGIYKLVTETDVELPDVPVEPLIKKYAPKSENIWLIYAGVLRDLGHLELTRKEQKILDDFKELEALELKNDFEIYRAFEGKEIESVILYAVLKDKKTALHYLDDLKEIKIQTTGKDLEAAGFTPSPKYREIFDFLLQKKLENPEMTLEDEICEIKRKYNN